MYYIPISLAGLLCGSQTFYSELAPEIMLQGKLNESLPSCVRKY